MPNLTIQAELDNQTPAVDIYTGDTFVAQVALLQPLTDFERVSFLFDDGAEVEVSVTALRQCGLAVSGNNITVIDNSTLAVAQQPGASAVLAVVKGVGEVATPADGARPQMDILFENAAGVRTGLHTLAAGKCFSDSDVLEFHFDWEDASGAEESGFSPISIFTRSFEAGAAVKYVTGDYVHLRRNMELTHVSDTQFNYPALPDNHYGPRLVKIIGLRLS